MLDARHLRLLCEGLSTLESEMNFVYRAEPIKGDLLDIIKEQVKKIDNGADCLYNSFLLIIRKSDAVVVGSTAFKGSPNEDGLIEIGYGLGKQHEGHGYATESVRAMCDWAFREGIARNVIAETEPGNDKSERVLERCGFVKFKDDTNTWWKL